MRPALPNASQHRLSIARSVDMAPSREGAVIDCPYTKLKLSNWLNAERDSSTRLPQVYYAIYAAADFTTWLAEQPGHPLCARDVYKPLSDVDEAAKVQHALYDIADEHAVAAEALQKRPYSERKGYLDAWTNAKHRTVDQWCTFIFERFHTQHGQRLVGGGPSLTYDSGDKGKVWRQAERAAYLAGVRKAIECAQSSSLLRLLTRVQTESMASWYDS